VSFAYAHADDIRQEQDIAAWLAFKSFDPSRGVPLAAWCAMAAKRAPISYLRAWNHSRSYGNGIKFAPLSAIHAAAIEPHDYEPRLERGIAALPDRERETIRLYYWDGWPFREIAERFGVAESTVTLYHKNAIRKLKGFLCTKFFAPSCSAPA